MIRYVFHPVIVFVLGYCILAGAQANKKESYCYGTTSDGKLENGVQLPLSGDNYVSYSYMASKLGRTYVHSEVYDIVLKSYARLHRELPDKVYKYAETGFKNGGQFKPHRTHRNGLSVDFMTPVLDQNKRSVHLPTHPLNKLGYNIDFTGHEYDGLTMDFESLAAHIVALHKESKAKGYDLWRVIFAPDLQPGLFKTRYAEYLKQHIQFSKKPSWVRHDEHYHVDFDIPCK